MRKFETLTGAVAPLVIDDVNTDLIIPIQHCINVARAQLGRYAFEPLRYLAGGADNPEFILNRPCFRGAPILLGGVNFGCGSSREPAVWALAGLGIRAVIARSFGGIFYANCLRNGLLPIALPAERYDKLVALTAGDQPVTLTIDLHRCEIVLPNRTIVPFEIEAARRHALLEGLDEIGQTLLSMQEIVSFQEMDRARRPWIWETVPEVSSPPPGGS
jgi:3-isopropylmalate/(R)-2-methylmalate dehydratase small subunit